MKKIVLAVTLFMVYNISMACNTYTTIVQGKMIVCTVCPTVTICN